MFDMIPFDRRNGGLFDAFDKAMNDSFFSGDEKQFAPCRTDILDAGDKFILKADMPGFRKEDIKISLDGDQLTIRAERKESENGEKVNYIRRERRYDSLSRSFTLDGINTAAITASCTDGVLRVELPKAIPEKPEAKSIEVK